MAMRLLNISNLPIRYKMIVAILGTSLFVLLINAVVYLALGWGTTKTRIEHELKVTSQIYAENVSAALSFNDEQAANTLLASLKVITELELACVYKVDAGTQEADLFAQYSVNAGNSGCKSGNLLLSDSEMSQHLEVISPVKVGNDLIGYVYFRRTIDDLVASTKLSATTVLLTLLISIAVAYSLASFFRRLIERPIGSLLAVTQKLSNDADFTTRVEKFADDEIGSLIDSFNNMLAQIQERDTQLRATRRELELRVSEVESSNNILNETLVRLKKTQEQLVHQEKMASLGALVAGVAHEINTPIGVGVTASSTLHGATEETLGLYENGKLTDSGLRKYMSTAMQSANILLTNLNRAANLIHSFKQVAVDQSSSETRQFNLREYIDEVLLSLRPRIKKTQVAVTVDVDSSISVHSYPGAISQILTNLVINSLIHAFPNGEAGEILVACELLENDEIRMHYTDNGVGMSDKNLQKIFDPFFTTRRGAGGSGLGMHIVYNLVNQQLGGSIAIESTEGQGIDVVITFPSNIRHQRIAQSAGVVT